MKDIRVSNEMHLANKINLLQTLKYFAEGDKERLKILYTEFMEFLHNE